MLEKNLKLIIQELRVLDYNSYLCTTFCEKKDFHKISAILLLQAELKKISDITDEDMVGMIRLAWWKENLQDIFLNNKSKNHHLLDVILSFKNEIDLELLLQAFEGFEKDFSEEKKFQNKAQLENYIFKTQEVFLLIILKILNFSDENLVKKIAKNLALISFNFELLKKIKNEDEKIVRFFYPEFFEELNIEIKSWKKNSDEGNLLLVVKHLVSQINLAAEEIKKIEKLLPKNLKNLIVKKDLVQILLQDLRRNNYDIFASKISAKSFFVKIKFLIKIMSRSA